jgi:hypothetical protein
MEDREGRKEGKKEGRKMDKWECKDGWTVYSVDECLIRGRKRGRK